MRAAALIAWNDLRLLLRNRSSYVWLFGMPLAFVYFLGFAARGPGDPANRRPPVIVENLDEGPLGGAFVEELAAQGLWRVDTAKGETAERGIRVPADFTARLLARQPQNVVLHRIGGSSEADAAIIEVRLARALVVLNARLIEVGIPDGATAPDLLARLGEARAKADPVTLDARFAGRRPRPAGFSFSLPGNLVMYLLMNLLIFGGATLATSRRGGLLRRVSVAPVSRGALVAGTILGLILLGAVQIAVVLAFGGLALGVNLGANLPAIALVLLVFAWAAASAGVLIGSLVDAPERVAAVCVFTSLLLAALGGCWWPVEIAPPALQTVAACLPTGWALGALHRLISFGGGLADVVPALLKLSAFAVVVNVAAARAFRV